VKPVEILRIPTFAKPVQTGAFEPISNQRQNMAPIISTGQSQNDRRPLSESGLMRIETQRLMMKTFNKSKSNSRAGSQNSMTSNSSDATQKAPRNNNNQE